MISVMKNTLKILLKRKSFIISTFLLPIALIFLFSMMYMGASDSKIAVVNNDQGELGQVLTDKLSNLDGIQVVKPDKNADTEGLIFHKYEVLVTIDENYTQDILNGNDAQIKVKSISENETKAVVTGMINSESQSLALLANNIDLKNEGIDKVIETYKNSKPDYTLSKNEEKRTSVTSSVGIIIYLIFISAGFSTVFLLEDESNGTKERTLMSKVSEKEYYGGLSIIFFLSASIPAIEYYAISKIFNYEFGFNNTYLLLVLMLIFVLLAVVFNVFLTTVFKNKAIFGTIGSTLTIPIFMLSGAFWPYEFMSSTLQKIGNALPPRWFFVSIERLQNGGTIIDILPYIFGLLLVILVLFLLSVFATRNKIVFVKENR